MGKSAQVGALRSVILNPFVQQFSMSRVRIVMHLLWWWSSLMLLLLVMLLLLLLLLLLLDWTLAREVQVLSRYLCKRLKRRQLLRRREREVYFLSVVHWSGRIRDGLRHVVREGQLVELQQRPLAIAQR
jgi:hypothetical protein